MSCAKEELFRFCRKTKYAFRLIFSAHPQKMEITKEELLLNINAYINASEAFRVQAEGEAWIGDNTIFRGRDVPLYRLIISLGKGCIPAEDKIKESMEELLNPPFWSDLQPVITHIREYDVLVVSCLMLMYHSHPEIVKKEINSVDDASGAFLRHIACDILGSNVTRHRINTDHKDAGDIYLRAVQQRVRWYTYMGLDMSDFRFAYYLARETITPFYIVTHMKRASFTKGRSEIEVKASKWVLKMCFENGLTLGTFDRFRKEIPSVDRMMGNSEVCEKPLKGMTDPCCNSCVAYQIMWVAHKEFVNESTLYDILAYSLAKSE